MRLGADYPYDELDALWQQVLLHEFHDILPGTSIAWVHREAVSVLSGVLDDARALSKYRAEGATPAEIRRMLGL